MKNPNVYFTELTLNLKMICLVFVKRDNITAAGLRVKVMSFLKIFRLAVFSLIVLISSVTYAQISDSKKQDSSKKYSPETQSSFPDTVFPKNRKWNIACKITDVKDGIIYYTVNGIPLSIKETLIDKISWHSSGGKSDIAAITSEKEKTGKKNAADRELDLAAPQKTMKNDNIPVEETENTIPSESVSDTDTLYLTGLRQGTACSIISVHENEIEYLLRGRKLSIKRSFVDRFVWNSKEEFSETVVEKTPAPPKTEIAENVISDKQVQDSGEVSGRKVNPAGQNEKSKLKILNTGPPANSTFPDTIFPANKKWQIPCRITGVKKGRIYYKINQNILSISGTGVDSIIWNSEESRIITDEKETVLPETIAVKQNNEPVKVDSSKQTGVKAEDVLDEGPEKDITLQENPSYPDTIFMKEQGQTVTCKILKIKENIINYVKTGPVLSVETALVERVSWSSGQDFSNAGRINTGEEKITDLAPEKEDGRQKAPKRDIVGKNTSESIVPAEEPVHQDTIYVKNQKRGISCNIVEIRKGVIYYKVKDIKFSISTSYIDKVKWSSQEKHKRISEAGEPETAETDPYMKGERYSSSTLPDTIFPLNKNWNIACRIMDITRDTVFYKIQDRILSIGKKFISKVSWSSKENYSEYGKVPERLKPQKQPDKPENGGEIVQERKQEEIPLLKNEAIPLLKNEAIPQVKNTANPQIKNEVATVALPDTIYTRMINRGIPCRVLEEKKDEIIYRIGDKTLAVKKAFLNKVSWNSQNKTITVRDTSEVSLDELTAYVPESRKKEIISVSKPKIYFNKEGGRSSVTLGPGDDLSIKLFYNPELNENIKVRMDGNISLQLVGEIHVEGATVPELTEHLKEKYSKYLRNPDVAVIARSMYNNRIFVTGEVRTPGTITMTGRMTALEAVMQAGGFKSGSARRTSVVLLRIIDGQRYAGKLDLSSMKEGKMPEPFDLMPRDIIFVPKTLISSVTQWVDRNIYSLLPPWIVYSKETGAGTLSINSTLRSVGGNN